MAFPCHVDIKVFVRASDGSEARVRDILEEHLPPAQIVSIRIKQSRKGNYHSMSCRVNALNRPELDNVFNALSNDPAILMVI